MGQVASVKMEGNQVGLHSHWGINSMSWVNEDIHGDDCTSASKSTGIKRKRDAVESPLMSVTKKNKIVAKQNEDDERRFLKAFAGKKSIYDPLTSIIAAQNKLFNNKANDLVVNTTKAADPRMNQNAVSSASKIAPTKLIVRQQQQALICDPLTSIMSGQEKLFNNKANNPGALLDASAEIEISRPFVGKMALRIEHQRRLAQEQRRQLLLQVRAQEQSHNAISWTRHFDSTFFSMTPL